MTGPDVLVYGPPLAPPVELSRWLLELQGVPYRFETAAAGLSAIRSRREKVPIELPLLYLNNRPSGGLRDAFRRVTSEIPDAFGKDHPVFDRSFVERQFTELFGPAVRTFYRHMLPCPRLLKPLATACVPAIHRMTINALYPLWARVMAKGLGLSTYRLENDLENIARSFADVEGRSSAQAHSNGDRPGVDDIVFAALASPILLPAGHPVKLPPKEQLPLELRAIVTRFRESAAGAYALRTYTFR